METNSDQFIDEPKSKRPKMDTDRSTSSKSKLTDDCPILMLPPDILAKIIAFIPVAQWPALELLYDFRPATLIAWRQLRNVNVEREFLIKPQTANDRSTFGKCLVSILQKLVERSPFLITLRGIELHRTNLVSDVIHSLVKFEHLQSITLGDRRGEMLLLDDIVEFLELTRSRTTLKELNVFNIDKFDLRDAFLERFTSSFLNGQDIPMPLKLEKFTFALFDHSFSSISLDILDSRRLIDLRLGNASIEPQQLTRLIARTPSLRRIEFVFLHCDDSCNGGPRLQANKKLLIALGSHKNLSAIKLDCSDWSKGCVCVCLDRELIQMLKTVGRQLRKLALGKNFLHSSIIDMKDLCSTIRNYIPYLQSIKLECCEYMDISHENLSHIVSMSKLAEMHLRMEAEADGEKFAPLPCLKRLALDGFLRDDGNLLQCLANATALLDLRIVNADNIRGNDFEEWGEGIASKLQILMLGRIAEKVEPYIFGEIDVEQGLVRLLRNASRLRVLILKGHITDRMLMAIAKSCPKLEIFGVQSNGITVPVLQEIVDRCPKLKRLGGFSDEFRNKLQFPKYRKICDVDVEFWRYDFDSGEYD